MRMMGSPHRLAYIIVCAADLHTPSLEYAIYLFSHFHWERSVFFFIYTHTFPHYPYIYMGVFFRLRIRGGNLFGSVIDYMQNCCRCFWLYSVLNIYIIYKYIGSWACKTRAQSASYAHTRTQLAFDMFSSDGGGKKGFIF